jgi:serine phosphatase RsbU (regulator of sigma subunit)
MERRTLTFARAGHNPLLVRKNKFSVMELLNPKGIAIGMEKGPLFSRIIEEQSVHVEPGDIFIFYTDGISEAMNTRGEEFGEERLETLLRQNASGSAKDILENIRKSVFDFAGNAPQHDDFTMVVVKIHR